MTVAIDVGLMKPAEVCGCCRLPDLGLRRRRGRPDPLDPPRRPGRSAAIHPGDVEAWLDEPKGAAGLQAAA